MFQFIRTIVYILAVCEFSVAKIVVPIEETNYNSQWKPLSFRNQLKCVYVITKHEISYNRSMELFLRSFYTNDLSLLITTSNNMVQPNYLKKIVEKCDHLLFLDSAYTIVTSIVSAFKSKLPQFSRIFILNNGDVTNVQEINKEKTDFIYDCFATPYHCYELYYNSTANQIKLELKNILNNQSVTINSTLDDIQRIVGTNEHHSAFDSKLNPTKKSLRVVFFDCEPYVMFSNEEDKQYDGIEFRIMEQITGDWNKEYTMLKNASLWDALVYELSNGRADISLCSLWMVRSSFMNVTPSRYYDYQCRSLLTPKQEPSNQFMYIAYPFSTTLWIILLFTLGISGLIIFWVLKYNQSEITVYELDSIYLNLIAVLTNHSIFNQPNELKYQLIIGTWSLMVMIITMIYSTKYASTLTTPIYTHNVETFQDFLAGHHDLKWDGLTVGGNEYQLDQSIFDKLYNSSLRAIPPSRNVREIMLTGRFVHLVKLIANRYISETETLSDVADKFRLLEGCATQNYVVFGLTKGSAFQEMLNPKMQRLIESGIIQHWLFKIYIKYNRGYMTQILNPEHNTRVANVNGLSLKNVSAAFYCHIIGLCIAIIIFICEKIHHSTRQSHT